MLCNKKGTDARRTTLWRFFPVLMTLVLLIPGQNVYAAVETTSGSAQMGNTLQNGSTSYTVSYSYPATAEVGKNLTLSLTMHVDSLSGLIEYAINYFIVVNVFIGNHHLNATISAPNGAPFLYPGANWGPNNVTIPLTEDNTGVAKGQSANATVSVTYGDWIYMGGVLKGYFTEPPMQGQAGTFLIQNGVTSSTSTTSQAAGQSYLPYVLMVSGAVLMVSAALLFRGPRPPLNQT